MESLRPAREPKVGTGDFLIFDAKTSSLHIFHPRSDALTPPATYKRDKAAIKSPIAQLLVDHLIAPPFNCKLNLWNPLKEGEGFILQCEEPSVWKSIGRHEIVITCADVNAYCDRMDPQNADAPRFEDMRQFFDSQGHGTKILTWVLENVFGASVHGELTKDALKWSFTLLVS